MEETIDLDVDVGRIQQELLRWYEENHREFPWRNTTDPYKILVSEVMSQQTQLSRVETAWKAFIDRWPSVNALANTEQAAVVQFWTEQKLGYNNRAKYLHTAAQQVVEDYNGEIPESPEELESLTGVGPYTANAVASLRSTMETLLLIRMCVEFCIVPIRTQNKKKNRRTKCLQILCCQPITHESGISQ